MVMGHKHGTLTTSEYREQYAQILARVPQPVWDALASRKQQTLLCYCRDGWFCHTHELIEFAVRQFPQRFADGRTERGGS
jgi:hypothetical protein